MLEGITKAVWLALSYVDGAQAVGAAGSTEQARAFLEHLARQGYIVRPRGRERVRLHPQPLDKKRISGTEIRTMRVALDLTVNRLAARAGINHETLARIESGQTSPQSRTVTAILDALAAARAEAADQNR